MNPSRHKVINLVHLYTNVAGLEVLLPQIVNTCVSIDFFPFVIRPHQGFADSIYSNPDLKITYGSRNNIVASLKLFFYATKRKNEIFHVFNIGPLFLLVLRLAGIKRIIYSIHGTIYWQTFYEKLFRKILWGIAIDHRHFIFTSNSEYSGKIFNERISPLTRCTLLYNFFDTARFSISESKNIHDTIRRIIYVGRLANGKGLDIWIETALKIHIEFPDVIFEIYGSGPLSLFINQKINYYQATEFIILKGHMNNIEAAYWSADILLFLSEYESFGNVVVESILCNTPVLVTPIPSMKELFLDFPYFILSEDFQSGEEIIEKLKNINKLRILSEKARTIFSDRFSLKKHIESLTQLYESI